MSENSADREDLLTRWSRRKREHKMARATAPDTTPAASGRDARAQEGDAFADFDFESLNFTSDYARFMASAVPEHVQRAALRKLWTSTDIISQADELDDYLEDFREEAMALPAEMVRSAYRIGRGFVEGDKDAAEPDEQCNAPEHAASRPEAADARAIVDNRDKPAGDDPGISITGAADVGEYSPKTRQAEIVKPGISCECIERQKSSFTIA